MAQVPPAPPAPPGQPPAAGPPPGNPPGPPGAPGPRWTPQRLLVLGGAVVVIGLVLAAFILATRKPPPDATSSTVPTASVSASPSATPTDVPTPSPSPTATSSASSAPPTATPVPPNTPAQQAALLYPGTGTECGGNGVYSGCPVDDNLVVAATAWRSNHGASAAAPLCRCSDTWSGQAIGRNDALLPVGLRGNRRWAAVTVQLSFSPRHEAMVVIFALQADGTWLADDTFCGNPQNRLGSPGATSCVH